LDPKEFSLMKSGVEGVPKLEEWLLAVLPQGSRVAIDPSITSMASLKALKTAFKDQLSLVFLEKNLVDEVWAGARPAYSKNPLTVLPESYTGESSASKVERLRKKMSENKSALLLACALDEVAWLFNLRGADIPFNPVFRSYALLAADSVTLYVDVDPRADDLVRRRERLVVEGRATDDPDITVGSGKCVGERVHDICAGGVVRRPASQHDVAAAGQRSHRGG